MNYEEAYKEAIKRAKAMIKVAKNEEAYNSAITIFPELKRSDDDERIRTLLISSVKNETPIASEHNKELAIAWLEKQGEPNPYSGTSFKYDGHTWGMCARDYGVEIIFDGELKAFLSPEKSFIYPIHPQPDITSKSTMEESVGNPNCVKPIDKVESKFHEGDWFVNNITKDVFLIKSVNGGYCTLEDIEGNIIYPCLPPCEGETHLWTIQDAKDGDVLQLGEVTAIFKKYIGQEKCICYCSISEDGDFEIPIENGEDNVYGCTDTTPATKEQRDLLFSEMKEAGYRWNINKKELEEIEQKPINDTDEYIVKAVKNTSILDMVEPKFHEGDWVVNNNSGGVYQVTKIRDAEYCLWPLDAKIEGYLRIIDVNNDYHLWTIQDAKPGDILITKEDKMPFIFKGFDRFHPNCPVAYCGIDSENLFLVSPGDGWWTDEEVEPATKEQCDILFTKMKEAGYAWDPEKKELKEIEQKSNWNEEDEHRVKDTIYFLENAMKHYASTIEIEACIEWLETLKLRIGGKL